MIKKYAILQPAVFKLDGGAMFGIIPKPLWSKKIASDESNRIALSLRLMLIQTAHKNILIDTGIGDYHDQKFNDRFAVMGAPHPLISVLKNSFQLEPEDVTDLIISHLHFDHAGGLGGDPTSTTCLFSNATLHVHKKHFEYALKPTLRDSGSFHSALFRPIIEKADKLNKINWLEDEDGIILSDGDQKLYYKCSHGHTPWLVHAYDEKFIYMADLVPTSAHIPLAWVMGYDMSPGQTTADKKSFYQFIEQQNLTMIFEHDIQYWGAKIEKKSEDDFELKETFRVFSPEPGTAQVIFDPNHL